MSLFNELNTGIYSGDLTAGLNQQILYNPESTSAAPTQQAAVIPPVDTSTWKQYVDKTYNFSFKYNPDWKILPAKKQQGFSVIEIDPGKKYYNFKIYISQTGFYVMDGLPLTTETIGGAPAQNLVNVLFGIKKDPYFFTFDIGSSLSLKPQFDAMVRSVSFSN